MYWIDEFENNRGSSNQISFFCDDESDIEKLPNTHDYGVQQGDNTVSNRPCGMGSSCLCLDTSELYILNSQDEWKKI